MKKKMFVLFLVLSMLASATVVSAAGSGTVKATLSKLKIYLGNNKISGSVLTYNNNNYIPVNLLSNNLGFEVSTSKNKLTITETISKDDLLTENENLKSENNNLNTQVNDLNAQIKELNEKLRFYSGGKEDNTNQTGNEYFDSLNYATSREAAVWPSRSNQFIKTSRDNTNETWYKVDVKEGQGLTVALHPQIDKGDMELYLYDKNGSRLNDKFYINNGLYGTVGANASTDTTYYVKVTGSAGIYYIGFYDHYYNNNASQNDERDFFGTLSTSKKILSGDVTRSDSNLTDYYRVDVKEGQTLNVSIYPQIDKGDMKLYLYDKDGSKLDDKFYINNGKSGSVTKKASRDCTYFVAVTGPAGKYFLSYTVN